MSEVLASIRGSSSRRGGLRSWLGLAVAFASGAACAADFSVGAGAGVSRGRVDCLASWPCDRGDVSYKLFAGYQISQTIDVRLSYFGGGSFKGADVTPAGTEFGGRFKVSGVGFTVGYLWNFAPAWSLQGRAGAASVQTRFEYAAPFSGSVSKTTTQPLAGLSLGCAVTRAVRIGLDYDVTRLKAHKTHGPLQTLGLSAQYAF